MSTQLEVPASPVFQPSALDWQALENKLEIVLPEDYKKFVSTYGSGVINDFIGMPSPAEPERPESFQKQMEYILDAMDPQKYPEPDNRFEGYFLTKKAIPWASTTSGDFLYFLYGANGYEGILVNDHDRIYWEFYPISFSEYLERVLSGNLITKVFHMNFINSTNKTFVPLKVQGSI